VKYDKVRYERDVFEEFARTVGLQADAASIKQNEPPLPDIACAIDGEHRYFELTRLTDDQIERKVIKGLSGYTNFRIGLEEIANAIRIKCAKTYLKNAQIDLVVHEGATPVDGLWARGDETRLRSLLQAAVEDSQFERIWFVDFSSKKFLVARKSVR
jgi:hypothetical protein